ncbi:hypothetical protein HYPSUDRAFT_208585 [Hypholoma sublateritium FD-334 SS-4]|uniref:RNA polymerase Rpb1 domain-containing protein n=1 Tax=Hypholoma sublateritium (strain FD-334 SS-4) TaxID=945553 RepID=A0A0D2NDB0_HYPSF|nr:hypothetical protein HYPSUDRAFT_208585 [Hypholoma sublateritium FD-334 SS-4]
MQMTLKTSQYAGVSSKNVTLAVVEIWYDPYPSLTIIKEASVFVESFFTIPDEEMELKLHLQSAWLLRPNLN